MPVIGMEPVGAMKQKRPFIQSLKILAGGVGSEQSLPMLETGTAVISRCAKCGQFLKKETWYFMVLNEDDAYEVWCDRCCAKGVN